jgi:hypothetical protein
MIIGSHIQKYSSAFFTPKPSRFRLRGHFCLTLFSTTEHNRSIKQQRDEHAFLNCSDNDNLNGCSSLSFRSSQLRQLTNVSKVCSAAIRGVLLQIKLNGSFQKTHQFLFADFNHHSTSPPCMIAGFRGEIFRPSVPIPCK